MCDRNIMQVNLFVSGAENMGRKQVVWYYAKEVVGFYLMQSASLLLNWLC
jgi:hypothetical protein